MEKGDYTDNNDVVVASAVTMPPGAKAVTVPPGNASSSVPMWQQQKQGAKCCFCCCDYRRAVIIIAVINTCLSLAGLILALVSTGVPTTQYGVDDDVLIGIVEDSLWIQAIFYGVSLVCSICALVGAIRYNIPLVAINTLWLVGNFIAGTIVSLNTVDEMNTTKAAAGDDAFATVTMAPSIAVSAVVMCLFMYPNIGFMYEVKVGIMSYETYPREEYSCCCAPGARRG